MRSRTYAGWLRAFAATSLSLSLSSGLDREAAAGESLDVRAWLDRPGVKMLAVEFYATWCKPCMEAVPRWKALHERYRKDGLRLVVVATQDPQGGCVNPGWNPDDIVCDDEGFIARSFGAAEKLPAAFLWSWQGRLLVRHGEVGEVESAISAWSKEAPRIVAEVRELAPGAGLGAPALAQLVTTELDRTSKLVIVAGARERTRLDALRAESFKARFDDSLQCEVGKELSANSLLEARITGAPNRQRLALTMLSIERGCLVASSVVDWNAKNQRVAVAEGIAELMQKLRSEIQMPGRGGSPASTVREDSESWKPEGGGERVIVTFRSDPPGAVVLVDGNLTCQDTSQSCAKAISLGEHTVTMQKERFAKKSERVTVKGDLTLEWRLEPDFATLSVPSPVGLELTLDGVALGKTPFTDREIMPGAHELKVADPCFEPFSRKFSIGRSQHQALTLDEVKPRLGALDVVAEDEQGNAVKAEVFAGGIKVGVAPGVVRVSVCTTELEVRHEKLGIARERILVVERKTTPVRAVLKSKKLREVRTPPGYSWLAPEVDKLLQENYFDSVRLRPAEMSAGAVEVLRAALPGASLGEPPGNSVPLGTALPRLLDPLAVGAVGSKYGRAALELTALNGALAKLDPHTLLFSPEEYAELTAATNGKFGGLGIVLSVRDGALKVMSVIPGTPAAIGELAAGDTITRIGTQDTDGLPIDKAVTLLRGDPGSKIEITVRPEGAKQARRVELTRQIIRIQNVESRKLEGGIGYVLLKQFNAETEKNLTEHLAKLEEGGGLSGLVLDLRGNPGGLLDQAVKVADRFLAHGEIVTTAGRVERQRKDATVQPADILEVPMVVLVSYGSASSSEVVAAALQANDRAVVMGERTFGKGTVQVIYNLKHGFAMKMTIAQYVTGGRAFEEVGIQPDIVTLSSRAVERRDTRDRGERTAAVVINYTAEDKGALAEYPIELARKVLSSSGRKDRKAMLAASRSLLEYESKAGR